MPPTVATVFLLELLLARLPLTTQVTPATFWLPKTQGSIVQHVSGETARVSRCTYIAGQRTKRSKNALLVTMECCHRQCVWRREFWNPV